MPTPYSILLAFHKADNYCPKQRAHKQRDKETARERETLVFGVFAN
jgi:hypothetical protein